MWSNAIAHLQHLVERHALKNVSLGHGEVQILIPGNDDDCRRLAHLSYKIERQPLFPYEEEWLVTVKSLCRILFKSRNMRWSIQS